MRVMRELIFGSDYRIIMSSYLRRSSSPVHTLVPCVDASTCSLVRMLAR